MKGIPNMRNTQINFNNVQLKTTFSDITHWIPSLSSIKEGPLQNLGVITMKGNFNGTLYDFVSKAQSLGLRSGLAGSLSKAHVDVLLSIGPSYLGFRGALCDQSKRTATLNGDRVQQLAEMLHRDEAKEVALRFVNQTACALI